MMSLSLSLFWRGGNWISSTVPLAPFSTPVRTSKCSPDTAQSDLSR